MSKIGENQPIFAMPQSFALALKTMNIAEAKEIVEREVISSNPDCALLEESTSEFLSCFVFYYQSKKYIESGKFEEQYVGQGPVIVCKNTGKVFETGSAYSTEHYVSAFEKCGDPFGEPTNRVKITGWNEGANKVQATKLVKAISGSNLSEAKKVIDSALLNAEPSFIANTDQMASEAVVKLKGYGFDSKQLWSNQC